MVRPFEDVVTWFFRKNLRGATPVTVRWSWYCASDFTTHGSNVLEPSFATCPQDSPSTLFCLYRAGDGGFATLSCRGRHPDIFVTECRPMVMKNAAGKAVVGYVCIHFDKRTMRCLSIVAAFIYVIGLKHPLYFSHFEG